MKRQSRNPIGPNVRLRVLINGIGVYCRRKDICARAILEIVDLMDAERAAGRPCIGYGTRVSTGHNVQIDIVQR